MLETLILLLIFVAILGLFTGIIWGAIWDKQLNRMEAILMQMNEQERQLNESINSLRDVSVNGFESLKTQVSEATGRVIGKMEEKDIDLSEEIKMLNDLTQVVSNRTEETVASLQGIAPADVSAPAPAPEEPADETSSEVVSEEIQSTEDNSGEEVSDSEESTEVVSDENSEVVSEAVSEDAATGVKDTIEG